MNKSHRKYTENQGFIQKDTSAPTAPPLPCTTLAAKNSSRRLSVRRSPVHGNGVFAAQPLAEGEKLLEYKGERISWEEAEERHPHDPSDPNHTFFFQLESSDVIDGGVNGNSARWINHSCAPNCETREEKDKIFIYALRNIQAGEEITYDYGLVLDGRHTRKIKEQYACYCGNPNCRGTMLASKRKR